MSREELKNLIHTAEHNLSLRKEIKKCKNEKDLIYLASNYGFTITMNDLREFQDEERLESWFNVSRINPIRKN